MATKEDQVQTVIIIINFAIYQYPTYCDPFWVAQSLRSIPKTTYGYMYIRSTCSVERVASHV